MPAQQEVEECLRETTPAIDERLAKLGFDAADFVTVANEASPGFCNVLKVHRSFHDSVKASGLDAEVFLLEDLSDAIKQVVQRIQEESPLDGAFHETPGWEEDYRKGLQRQLEARGIEGKIRVLPLAYSHHEMTGFDVLSCAVLLA